MPPQPKDDSHLIKSPKMPEKSVFYDRIVPVVFIVLALLTILLIAFSIGVLTGLIRLG